MSTETEEADFAFEPDRLIGQVLASRYQIEQRLGEGAMGTVYRAKHVKVGRAFAVKVLHSRLLADNKVRFAGEPVAGDWKLVFVRNNPQGYNAIVESCELDIDYKY